MFFLPNFWMWSLFVSVQNRCSFFRSHQDKFRSVCLVTKHQNLRTTHGYFEIFLFSRGSLVYSIFKELFWQIFWAYFYLIFHITVNFKSTDFLHSLLNNIFVDHDGKKVWKSWWLFLFWKIWVIKKDKVFSNVILECFLKIEYRFEWQADEVY